MIQFDFYFPFSPVKKYIHFVMEEPVHLKDKILYISSKYFYTMQSVIQC